MKNAESNGYTDASYGTQRKSTLQETITLLLLGKRVILVTFLIVTAAAAVYTYLSKPVYEASSTVILDFKAKSGSISFPDMANAGASSKIPNELETLKSNSMAEDVAKELLEKTYIDPEHRRLIPIVQATTDGNLREEKVGVEELTERLLTRVTFAQVRDADIIRISARSGDPQEAALLANVYAKAYAERNLAASRMKSKSIREFLQSQMSAKHQSLDTTEQALKVYMQESGVVSLDGESNKVVTQLSQLEATRDAIDVEISAKTKILASYKQELAQQEPKVARSLGESNDQYIRLLQEQLAKLEVQRDVVIAQNPELIGDKVYSDKLKEIDSQIASLKKNLKNRTQTFLATLLPGETSKGATDASLGTIGFLAEVKQKIIEQQIDLDGLVARKSALNTVIAEYVRQFNQIPQKSIELAKLQRSRLSNEKLYLLVEEKFNEAAITETSEFGYVTLMDRAVASSVQVSPSPEKNIGFGAIIGLILGIGIVLVRARLDDRIRTPEDLKKHGITPLSTISRMEDELRNGTHEQTPGVEGHDLDPHLVAFHIPFSQSAEGYRHLRTNVQYSQPDHPLLTITITSSTPKEGKSTTAGNLAITFANTQSRVLLVDADMRRPTIHTLFGLEQEPGLTDILFDKGTVEEIIHRNVVQNLDVLCSGTLPPNPVEILAAGKMREFIEKVSRIYSVVLFDSPPLLAVTDAALLSRITDGVVLVTSAGQTTLRSLDRAAEVLGGVHKKAIGVVLNNFDFRKASAGYQGYYAVAYGYTDSPGDKQGKRARSKKTLPKS